MKFLAKLFGRKPKPVEPVKPVTVAAKTPRYISQPSYPRYVPSKSTLAPTPAAPTHQSEGVSLTDMLLLNALMNSGHSSASRTWETCVSEPSPSYSSGGGGDFGGGGSSSSWSDSSSSSSSYSSSDSSSSSSSDSGSSSCSSSD